MVAPELSAGEALGRVGLGHLGVHRVELALTFARRPPDAAVRKVLELRLEDVPGVAVPAFIE
eukprot:5496945-Heterocapsa_arctica.AAC.1